MDYPIKPISTKKKTFLEIKTKFNPIMSTREPWVPKAHQIFLGNNSSVSYNIINNEKYEKSYITPTNPKRINFKKIGLTKYNEKVSPYNLHFNKQYKQAYLENPSIFKVYKGMFTGMYDNAIKNGNIYPPFKTKTHRELNKKINK